MARIRGSIWTNQRAWRRYRGRHHGRSERGSRTTRRPTRYHGGVCCSCASASGTVPGKMLARVSMRSRGGSRDLGLARTASFLSHYWDRCSSCGLLPRTFGQGGHLPGVRDHALRRRPPGCAYSHDRARSESVPVSVARQRIGSGGWRGSRDSYDSHMGRNHGFAAGTPTSVTG